MRRLVARCTGGAASASALRRADARARRGGDRRGRTDGRATVRALASRRHGRSTGSPPRAAARARGRARRRSDRVRDRRPASLLPLYRAGRARVPRPPAAGARRDEYRRSIGAVERRCGGSTRSRCVTDGAALLGDDELDAGRRLAVRARPARSRRRRPRLRRASRSRPGLEVVAFADLDAVALGVAAWQGRAVRIVPLDERRPPGAYAPLLDLLEELARRRRASPISPFRTPEPTGS